jgi:cellulose synthase/poly-beta-1,6-N-acetylglucosamine synthase-like glycosyltransferase
MIVSLLIGLPIFLACYAYIGYPAALWVLARRQKSIEAAAQPPLWPSISITVPAYNEEAQIRGLLESLLKLDYPEDRRQILVVSDASTDGTDAIVREFADRRVELLRLPKRSGKDAAERAVAPHLRGDLIVNTDASIRIHPAALKRLVSCFADPRVGLASGRDVSVGGADREGNAGESGYVGYEMWVRGLETRIGGIVGASGCLYAVRAELHRKPLPTSLSRDFAAALIARENGYRAVSVDDATCLVPRTTTLSREYQRKVRTMTRGMMTMAHKRHLLNPIQYGLFAWMLFSHKICRWLVPWAAAAGLAGLAIASASSNYAAAAFALSLGAIGVAGLGWALSEGRDLPRALTIPAYLLAGNVAAIHATVKALYGVDQSVWEPTRRRAVVETS